MDAPTELLLDVFAAVPQVMVCAKSADGRYTAANDAFVRRARCRTPAEVLGRRAADLFEPGLAASYEAQDRAVLLTGHPIRNRLEPIEDRSGERRWYLTTKVRRATPVGDEIVAVSVEVPLSGSAAAGLRAAIELARERCTEQVRVADLARAAGMSADRLERAMRRTVGVSPKQYLVRLRAERAAELLATTDRPIAVVAAECGYYDQSQMTRQFRALTGTSPRTYRATARRDR